MNAAADDWRRMAQEEFLPPGTTLVRTAYGPPRPGWEHDHCVFCFTKLVPLDAALEHRDALTEGYTTTRGTAYYWLCSTCVADFADEYGWNLQE
ncbi:hypothetical protein FHX82_002124 [Amycolatopsis bartoniae]|uniref:Uncharacterized protein n=1 Tax=Amycolatopsis bartoniae TaxID=941986 RepID=A0A8H9J415_9PSEU|nr:hypothetical protein [Amycolatopsis bartoniae]MBB2935104.1 hypothetical protein [Amycolatopsis bartoniae]TVT06985.1 hypothetical protein FNH07_17740 [Amycolatopsis bartoniae]GHF74378.1 hypothetical protein GCM10017566_55220 [Amycolatopsis bartoniae]